MTRRESATACGWLVWSSCAGLVVSCNLGGQTGDGSGENNDWQPTSDIAASLPPCANDSEPVDSVDAVVDGLSFTAQDVLDQVAGGVSSSLLWAPGPSEFEVFTLPEEGEGSVTLDIRYEGGEIRHLFHNQALLQETAGASSSGRSADGGAGSASEGQLDGGAEVVSDLMLEPCPPLLEIVVLVHLSTPGGALDESFEAVLTASAVDRISLRAVLPASEVEGELEVMTEPVVGDGPVAYTIDAAITPYGTYGRIEAQCASDSGEVNPDVAGGSGIDEATGAGGAANNSHCGTVAVWPAPGDCARLVGSPAVLPLGDRAGTQELSAEEAAERFAALPALPLQWRDGSDTELSLYTSVDGAMCVSPGQANGEQDGLWYGVTVTATTSDGRLDGSYSAFVSVYPRYASLSVALDGLSAQRAADRTGLTGVDFSTVDAASFSLMLGWDEATGYWGSLDAWGMRDLDDCPIEPAPEVTNDSGAGREQAGALEPELGCYVELEHAAIGEQGIAETIDGEL